MKWSRDPRTESIFKKLGIDFKVETMKIADIDTEESLNRQVRLGKKLIDDVVVQYALCMEKPEANFPMVWVNKTKRYGFLWSGNHRIAAAQLNGITEIECYVVNVYDE